MVITGIQLVLHEVYHRHAVRVMKVLVMLVEMLVVAILFQPIVHVVVMQIELLIHDEHIHHHRAMEVDQRVGLVQQVPAIMGMMMEVSNKIHIKLSCTSQFHIRNNQSNCRNLAQSSAELAVIFFSIWSNS